MKALGGIVEWSAAAAAAASQASTNGQRAVAATSGRTGQSPEYSGHRPQQVAGGEARRGRNACRGARRGRRGRKLPGITSRRRGAIGCAPRRRAAFGGPIGGRADLRPISSEKVRFCMISALVASLGTDRSRQPLTATWGNARSPPSEERGSAPPIMQNRTFSPEIIPFSARTPSPPPEMSLEARGRRAGDVATRGRGGSAADADGPGKGGTWIARSPAGQARLSQPGGGMPRAEPRRRPRG